MTSDPFEAFKATQREGWKSFAPLAITTTPSAAKLVRFAGVRPGQKVLDVGCGTGNVAISARRTGAVVTGIDLTPDLIAVAKENATIADVDDIVWKEGDVENLPFRDGEFDVVLSQFAHMFAPRPEVATKEMLRVLNSGGTIAFHTWPPELLIGRMFVLTASYLPPPPDPKPAPPWQWGDPNIVVQRLGKAVRDVTFDRAQQLTPALSPQHYRRLIEQSGGPVIRLIQMLKDDPARLAKFRREYDDLTSQYWDGNAVRQEFLQTRAIKV
ncbi:MAG TPA: class I SAM-dependent methyltransferase [Thermoplasmata archaeon]|nr:class I SAM-dependent methyltransferase [Thermoplasmata archaeon]